MGARAAIMTYILRVDNGGIVYACRFVYSLGHFSGRM